MQVARLARWGALAGAGITAWAVAETRRFGVTHHSVPVLPAGAAAVRLLHLSDMHLTVRQRRKIDWLAGLDQLVKPDITVVTGDFLGDPKAVPVLLSALGGLLERPGAFVLGSNDYFPPRIVNPFAYLMAPSKVRHRDPSMPWGDLVAGLRQAGWLELTNASGMLRAGPDALQIALRGVDDPHIGRADYRKVAGPYPPADLRVGVAHAPYLGVLDDFAADGTDLILAGHTHGGQVCLPGGRAIVTNCDIEPARASGLSKHGRAHLHVSPGIGTAPTAPVRLFCPPRAAVLELVSVE